MDTIDTVDAIEYIEPLEAIRRSRACTTVPLPNQKTSTPVPHPEGTRFVRHLNKQYYDDY